MANDPGAFWDQGIWDLSKWDTIAANGGWNELPDTWLSNFLLTNLYSGLWTEGQDVWTAAINSTDIYNVAWTGGDDVWVSSVQVLDPYSIVIDESPDIWAAAIIIQPPGISFINEKPDVWNALIYITLFPPIYGAGGGWGWSWYSDFPEWNSKRDVEHAYDNWRYHVQIETHPRPDRWEVHADTYSLPPGAVKVQQELMFGSQTFIDWEEEAIIEEFLK